jgi:hypothetical protein
MDRAQALSLLGLWRRTRPQEGTGWSGTVPLRAISPHHCCRERAELHLLQHNCAFEGEYSAR